MSWKQFQNSAFVVTASSEHHLGGIYPQGDWTYEYISFKAGAKMA